MQLINTQISGLTELSHPGFKDCRGLFQRCFDSQALRSCWGDRQVMQVNHSRTNTLGALRGLHLQLSPQSDAKLVRCIRGRVFDVAVDLRAGSSTLCQWHAVELSPCLGNALFIPEGCAHGFQVLESPAELVYIHSGSYEPSCEWAVRWDDPRIAISWPLSVTQLSSRDASHPLLPTDFAGLSQL